MDKVLVLDIAKCNGCRSCEIACATAKEGLASPALSRIRVIPFEDEDFYYPIVCQQCETPYCAFVCPTAALRRNPETGIVDWLEEKCVGCKMCMLACPYGCIVVSDKGYAEKCDLCGGDPECVKFCSKGTLRFVEPELGMMAKKKGVAERLLNSYAEVKY